MNYKEKFLFLRNIWKLKTIYIYQSLNFNLLKKIPKMETSPKAVSSPSSNNISETATNSNCSKRTLEDEEDEDWVKRIQLDPCPENGEVFLRRKLRKFVLMLSYCGKGYLGMQRNPGYRTIEDELLLAMLHGSLIKEEGVTCPQIYRFQRAARTDKGVSAARQIVSVKLPDDVDIPEVINTHLPEQIRVMKAVRVTQKFDAKTQCDSRSYSYLAPTFAFAPTEELTNEDYRITPDTIQQLRNILSTYKGTHNFHNFTARVKYTDQCANRYIMDINCSDPFIRNGLEWTMIKVKGQSFMLHQIRKMVGLAMAICKGYVPKEIFNSVWRQERRDIPIAPGLGLVLEEPHYEYYNKKYLNDGIHDQLNWEAEERAIQVFREKYIDSNIVNTELEEKTMLKWIETLSLHNFVRRDELLPPKQPEESLKNAPKDASNPVPLAKEGDKLETSAPAARENGDHPSSDCATSEPQDIKIPISVNSEEKVL